MKADDGSAAGGAGEDSPSASAAWARDAPETWLAIERASNGYVVRDAAARETWVVGDPDPLDAAASLLIDIGDRIGHRGRSTDERRVVVAIEPGRDWLRANPRFCGHYAIQKIETAESERWECVCGLQLLPIAECREGHDPYGESSDPL